MALNARSTVQGQCGTIDTFSEYMCQEKLDGVFVLWTGKSLFTKSGLPIQQAAFTRDLPYYPVVGELYLGACFQPSVNAFSLYLICIIHPCCGWKHAICNHTLGNATTLVTHQRSSNPLWAHARIVAFDIPGCPSNWPYVHG